MEWESPLALVQEGLGRLLYLLPASARRVQIEVTNRCNLHCGMCPRDLYGLEHEDMDLTLFRQILEALPAPVRRVTLVGWGESLLHRDLFTMIRLVQEGGREVQLTSNALLLRGDHMEQLLAHPPDYLAFSIDSLDEDAGDGHPLTVPARERIARVMARRGPGQAPYVSFQTTLHPGGAQTVCSIVRLAGRLGVERVALMRLDTRYVPGLERPDLEEERRIIAAAEAVGREVGVMVEHTLGFGRGPARHLYRLLRPWMYRMDRYCPKTFDYLYVTCTGEVTPCCALPRHVVGRVEEGLETIWQGPALRSFLRHQASICGSCDLLSVRHRYGPGLHLDPVQGGRGRPTPCES